MTPVRNWGEALLGSFASALALFFSAIPRIIGFAAILVIGWMIASALAAAAAALLRTVKFNDMAERSGLSKFVQGMGVRNDPAGVMADLVKWFIRLIVLVVAFDALGLPAVSQVLQQFLLWLPNLVVALVVLVIAGLVANAAHGIVRGATGQAGLGNPDVLANAARVAVWGFGIVVAVNQIGVGQALVNTLFMGLVAALAGAVALAFGLGGRDTAAQITQGWHRSGQQAAPKLAEAAAAARDQSQAPGDGSALPSGGDRLALSAGGDGAMTAASVGAQRLAMPPVPPREGLPLQARREVFGEGLMIRLPVRAERIAVDKEAVVTETVEVETKEVQDVVQVSDTVRREQVHIETHGDIEAERPDDSRPPPDNRGQARDRTPPRRPDGRGRSR